MAIRKELETKKAAFIAELEEVKKHAAGGFDYRLPMLINDINSITRQIDELGEEPLEAPPAITVSFVDEHPMKMTHEVKDKSVDDAGEYKPLDVKATPTRKGRAKKKR